MHQKVKMKQILPHDWDYYIFCAGTMFSIATRDWKIFLGTVVYFCVFAALETYKTKGVVKENDDIKAMKSELEKIKTQIAFKKLSN